MSIFDVAPRKTYAVGATAQTVFAVPFVFFDKDDLRVYVSDELQTLGEDYTVAGGNGAGGSVTLAAGVSNTTVAIVRRVPIERRTDFPTAGPFKMPALNREQDRTHAIMQQLQDDAVRALRLPDSDPAAGAALPALADRGGRVMGFDAEGRPVAATTTVEQLDGLTLAALKDGKVAEILDPITSDGALITIDTAVPLVAQAQVSLLIGGIQQVPGTGAYTVSKVGTGGRITLAEAVPTGVTVGGYVGFASEVQNETLAALAAAGTGADELPYYTGTATAARTPLTALGRTLLGGASAVSMRGTLGAAPLASPDFTGTPKAGGQMIYHAGNLTAATLGALVTNGDASAVTVGGNALGNIIPATARVVDTIADLRTLGPIQAALQPTVMVRGYYAAGDGGGGAFFWDASSGATDNGGTVIKPTLAITGRWRRIITGPISVRWFGAVGDGEIDDATSLQSAVDAAGAVGAEVAVQPGTYKTSVSITIPSGVTIRGMGGTITKPVGGTSRLLTINGVSDVSVIGLKLDGQRRNAGGVTGECIYLSGCDNVSIAECDLYDGSGGVGLGAGVTNLRVENNHFHSGRGGMGGGALGGAMCEDIVIIGNTFKDLKEEGIDLNFNVRRASITGNTLVNCSDPAYAGGGEAIDIGGDLHEDIIVSGNVIDLAGKAVGGITVKVNGSSNPTHRVVISDNIICNGVSSSACNGVYLTHPDNAIVHGNIISGVFTAVYVTNSATAIDVNDNQIIGAYNRGVYAESCAGVSIASNRIAMAAGAAGYALWVAGTVTNGFRITNNSVSGGDRGIVVSAGPSGLIQGNDVSGATTYGIFNFASGVEISDNRVHDNGGNGITIQNASNVSIDANVCTDNGAGQYGISILSGCSSLIVSGNLCTGTGQGGLRFAAATDGVTLRDNHIFGNAGGQYSGLSLLTNSSVDYSDAAGKRALLNAGNMGIGIEAPETALHVNKSAAGVVDALTLSNRNGATNDEVGIFFAPTGGTGNTRGAAIRAYNAGSNQIGIKLQVGPATAAGTLGAQFLPSGSVQFPAVSTTASAANAYLDSTAGNQLLRSTSSIRYKTDVEDLETARSDAILGLRPVWYRSLADADRKEWSWYGLIAEEVAAVEPRLVQWSYPTKVAERTETFTVTDDDGTERTVEEIVQETVPDTDQPLRPDGVQYDRLTVLLLDVVQRQNQRLGDLEAQLAALQPAAPTE